MALLGDIERVRFWELGLGEIGLLKQACVSTETREDHLAVQTVDKQRSIALSGPGTKEDAMKAKALTMFCAASSLFVAVAGAAAAQVGRQGPITAVAPSEAEVAACGQGDQAACRKGYEYYKARSDMGSAHLTLNPRAAGQIDADYSACTGGSRQACSAFAAGYRAYLGQAPNAARNNPAYATPGLAGEMPPIR